MGDTIVDGNDIQPLVDTLVSGAQGTATSCAYDLNSDGVVDMADVELFVDGLLNS